MVPNRLRLQREDAPYLEGSLENCQVILSAFFLATASEAVGLFDAADKVLVSGAGV